MSRILERTLKDIRFSDRWEVCDTWFGGTEQGPAGHMRSPSSGGDFGMEQVSGLASWPGFFVITASWW